MLLHRIRRRVSRELASRLCKRSSAKPVRGRYVSICFDDFPLSAATRGARILQDAGARGTYYLAAGLCGTVGPVGRIAGFDDARRLQEEGHEIGCHTFSHLDSTSISAAEFASELERNRKAVDFCELDTFAFPFGYFDWGAKREAASRFGTVRTAVKGVNRGHVDLVGLQSIPLYEADGKSGADRWLNELRDGDGWLIFYTHDVDAQPSRFGCTPELLEHCVRRAKHLGYEVTTVGAMAERLQ